MFHPKWRSAAIAGLFVLSISLGLAIAQSQHSLSGIVKSVDKSTKTMVVKTADGTEQTIKYTEKTGTDAYMAGKEGAQVTVKYTEEAGQKVAVGVKDATSAKQWPTPR